MVAAVAPFVTTASALDPVADLFAVVALLTLGAVALALAGLDTGTAFGGMGASREMTILALVEPTLLVAIFALSVPVGSTNLAAIVDLHPARPGQGDLPGQPARRRRAGLAMVAETGRLPVDNPSTHLELTMVHEAMVLEYAGPDLALVELASAMRLSVFLGLLANLFAPWGIATDAGVGAARARHASSSSSRSPPWARRWPRARCSWPSCGCSGYRSCWRDRSSWRCSPWSRRSSSADLSRHSDAQLCSRTTLRTP